MSAPLAIGAAGSSAIDEAHAPAAVRDGSPSVKQAYASAQSFEEMLLQQLSQSMLASSGLGEEGGGSEGGGEEAGGAGAPSSASAGAIGSLLPQALTEGVMREGGLGLAAQLMHSLDPGALATPPAAGSTGGMAAGAGANAGGASVAPGVAPTGGVSA
ncbi:MAG TPA: hypothetical protein VK756_06100 [Solirubrobacteraceae bacterium]|jgi:hypothetical protein|nr:hypothetical protein [Solirubrobacteraceae bacterium]